MTSPRPIFGKEVSHVTRRCADREYRFDHDYVDNLFGYLVAHAAKECQVRICALVVMANHYHIEVADEFGRLSDFTLMLNSLLAQSLNSVQKRVHISLFDNRRPSITVALDPDAAMKNIAYIMCNPIRAGLVDRPENLNRYKKLLIGPDQWGEEQVFEHPGFYFKAKKFKSKLSFVPGPPPGFEHLTLDEVKDLAWQHVKTEYELECEPEPAKVRRKKAKRKHKRQNAQTKRTRPLSPNKGFGLRPRYSFTRAAHFFNALKGETRFRDDYRISLEAFREGDRDVSFPWGTNRLRLLKLVDVDPPDDSGWYRFAGS